MFIWIEHIEKYVQPVPNIKITPQTISSIRSYQNQTILLKINPQIQYYLSSHYKLTL